MSTIADLIRSKSDPYGMSIAMFKDRFTDRESRTVTFHFADKSTLTFKVRYTLLEEEEIVS